MPVGKGRNRRHFRNQPVDLPLPDLGVEEALCLWIEGGESGDRADEHPHGMRIVPESFHELLDVLMDKGVVADCFSPFLTLGMRGQFAFQKKICYFQERCRMFCQLLNRIPAVPEDSLVAVDVRDTALDRCRVHERGIVGHQSKVGILDLDLSEINRPDRFVFDRDFVLLASSVVGDRESIRHGSSCVKR